MSGHGTELTLWNVLFAASFLVAASGFSYHLKLGIETSILVAGARCWIQLTLVSYILKDVFEARNPWLVTLLTGVLLLLGTSEAVFSRSKRTFRGMFLIMLGSLSTSLMIGLLGVKFAMTQEDQVWWEPVRVIPILGMLIGNAVSGVTVGVSYILAQVVENQDKLEMSLSFGASRYEAMQPILNEAVRLAVIPSINAMSVVGLISIPG